MITTTTQTPDAASLIPPPAAVRAELDRVQARATLLRRLLRLALLAARGREDAPAESRTAG